MARIVLRGSDPVNVSEERGRELKESWFAGELKGVKIDVGFASFEGSDIKRIDLESEMKKKEEEREFNLRDPRQRDAVEAWGAEYTKFLKDNPGKWWWHFLEHKRVYRIDDPAMPWNGTVTQSLGYEEMSKYKASWSSLNLMKKNVEENETRRLESIDESKYGN